jgi:succinoglycan biosynthesis protein ExoU
MSDTESSISIIIAAYNAHATIERAVRSALREPEVATVIVVDDASTDDTALRVRAADDGGGRLKLISLLRNNGPSAARNCAIEECHTAWLTLLDADDFFLPGRLKRLLRFADQADLIADDLWRIDEHTAETSLRRFLGPLLPAPRLVAFKEFVLSNITDSRKPRGELGFIKPLMRRSFLEAHGLRYQEQLRLGEDYELYARALACGAKLLLVPAEGYVSVVRANSLSGRHSIEDLRHLRDCDKKLATLPRLTPTDRQALRRHCRDIDCRLQWRLLIEAVKHHDIPKAFSCFLRPWPVPFYLARRLCEQLYIRLFNRLFSFFRQGYNSQLSKDPS